MPQEAPHLLADMRADAADHLHKGLGVRFRARPVLVARVHEDHHLADRRVEAQGLKVPGHLFHRLVEHPVQRAVVSFGDVLFVREEGPYAVQELPCAFDALRAPGLGHLQRAHEHLVDPQRVRAVFVHDVARVHHVLREPLAHLDAVLAQDHALVHKLFERLLYGAHALVVQVPVPDPAVHQVAYRVLRPADVQVDRQPVLQQFVVGEGFMIMRIDVAHVVPAAAGRAGHRAGLAGPLHAVFVVVLPLLGVFQRGLPVLSFIILQFGEDQGQLVVRQGIQAAVFRVDDRDGFAPVALPREDPFAEVVVDRALCDAHLLELRGDGLLGLLDGQPGKLLAVDQPAALAQVVALFKGVFAHVRPVDDLEHGDVVRDGVFKVALVVARHGHDRAGPVAGQHEVADEQFRLPPVRGVDALYALQAAAALALVQLRPVHVVLFPGLLDVGPDFFLVFDPGHQVLHQLPVRRQDHEGDTVDGLDTRREDAELAAADDLESDLNALALADPVALHVLRALRPVDLVQAFQQLLGEGGLVDDPLLHVLADHGIAAALALAVDDLVVRQHRAQLFAPVHGHVDVLGVAVQIQLLEDPLGPVVELRIARRDHLVPVVVEAQLLQLAAEGLDVFLREAFRMVPGGNGVLLRRQAERVVAHRMEDVIALHPLHPADDIRRGVALGMAGVQADAAGVGEHVQRVELGFGEIPYVRMEGLVLLPEFLPFRLDHLRVINTVHVVSPDP